MATKWVMIPGFGQLLTSHINVGVNTILHETVRITREDAKGQNRLRLDPIVPGSRLEFYDLSIPRGMSFGWVELDATHELARLYQEVARVAKEAKGKPRLISASG